MLPPKETSTLLMVRILFTKPVSAIRLFTHFVSVPLYIGRSLQNPSAEPTRFTIWMTNIMSLSYSPRWCPTPEQVMILEELYRNGIRTLSALHIQRITARLSFYGKITGKNVFYWFQNHKARNRQKLRRKLTKKLQVQHPKLQQCYQNPDKMHQQDRHSLDGSSFLSAFSTQQSSYSNAAGDFLFHEKGTVEAQSNIGPSHKWWMSKRQSLMEEKMMILYGDGGHVCSSSLKTLEFFPTTAAALKEDSNYLLSQN